MAQPSSPDDAVGISTFLTKLRRARKERAHVTISASTRHSPSRQTTKFDKDFGSPVAAPLDTLQAVLSWKPGEDELCVPSVPLRPDLSQSRDDPSSPKVIICHDMMGGYQKDSLTQGHQDLEDYYFYHWQHISAFIYFSHHFVSLPPPTWTNVSHRHGTLSMGTIITEWEDGAKLCHQLLSNESTVMLTAQQLVALAQYYHFDGWLVNIENPIQPAQLSNLYTFLSLLTTGMHEAIPGSKVIWYDSVTTEGNLRWQNSLNKLNEPFFSLCDGIFLNYHWNESALQLSAAVAGGRGGEVYVGIDVFGRGCYGGGGYNSCRAMEVIRRQGLSSALFAPGWVFETQSKERFFDNQDKFWSLLSPHCPCSALSGLPIVSSFGKGCGDHVSIDGKMVFKGGWTNLSAQDLQPSFTTDNIFNDPQSSVSVTNVVMDPTFAYNNGASLKILGKVSGRGNGKPSLARLFKTSIALQGPVLVALTHVPPPATAELTPCLQLTINSSVSAVMLDPTATPPPGEDEISGCGLPRSRDMPRPSWCKPDCVLLAPLPEPFESQLHQVFTGTERHQDGWRTSYFLLSHDNLYGFTVEEIGMAIRCHADKRTASKDFSITIGEIKVLDPRWLSPSSRPSSIRRLQCQDVECRNGFLSLTLTWLVVDNKTDPVEHCNVYSTCVICSADSGAPEWRASSLFLGRAYASCFRVAGLRVLPVDLRETPVSFEFRVQLVTASRRKPGVENSDCLVLQLIP